MKFRFAIIILLFSLASKAQEMVVSDTAKFPLAIKAYELPSDQWKAWQAIETEWKKEYSKILKEQKLKMTCSGCENIYMDVILTIDENGKLKHYRLLSSNKCSEKFSKGLEIRFMKYFFNLSFPKDLYNLNFEVRLGTGLKC